jgi:chorismate-pyruvate lyase
MALCMPRVRIIFRVQADKCQKSVRPQTYRMGWVDIHAAERKLHSRKYMIYSHRQQMLFLPTIFNICFYVLGTVCLSLVA